MLEEQKQKEEKFKPLPDEETLSPMPKSKRKKRRKRIESEDEDEDVEVNEITLDDDGEEVTEKVKVKPVKLAPIFGGKKGAKVKVVPEDPEKVAARKAFLSSSAPTELKQRLESSKDAEGIDKTTGEKEAFAFSDIGHIQQLDREEYSSLTAKMANAVDLGSSDEDEEDSASATLQSLVNLAAKDWHTREERELPSEDRVVANRMTTQQIYHFVNSLKMAHDSFPVRKIFRRYLERKLDSDHLEAEARRKNLSLNEIEEERLLRGGRQRRRRRRMSKKSGKKEEKEENRDEIKIKFDPSLKSSMQWTMKYAPQHEDDVIGNYALVRKLKTWLEGWWMRR